MYIVPDNPSPTEQTARSLPLLITTTDLPDHVALLSGHTLRVDAGSSQDDQLAAILDAVTYLWTGDTSWGRRPRHLSVVTA